MPIRNNDATARQRRSRANRAAAGHRQVSFFLTPEASEKLAAWVARGDTIASAINRLLVKSRP